MSKLEKHSFIDVDIACANFHDKVFDILHENKCKYFGSRCIFLTKSIQIDRRFHSQISMLLIDSLLISRSASISMTEI